MLGVWSFVSHDDDALGATVLASLAEALSAEGKRVLLFDLSPALPALDIALGVEDRVIYTLSDTRSVLPERIFLSPAREGKSNGEENENILLVPLFPGEEPCFEAVRRCIESVKVDVVLMRVSLSCLAQARTVSDGVILLTGASAVSLRAAAHLVQDGAFDGFVLTGVVSGSMDIQQLITASDTLSLPLCGILPRVDTKNTSSPMGKDFRRAVCRLAARLCGDGAPLTIN